jgi:DNA-binding NarL/FixJ family response regulator
MRLSSGSVTRRTVSEAARAQPRSNAAIAQRLFITERAVAKHTASIFLKLNLQPSDLSLVTGLRSGDQRRADLG